MRVTVTGGAGFLGQLVVRHWLDRGALEVTIVDVAAPLTPQDPRVTVATGDLVALAPTLAPSDVVVHLAAVVSSAAESDFDLGMHVNLDATRAVLEAARSWGTAPIVVFASSVAVFGQDPYAAPQGIITDDSLPRPQSSYGMQKFVGELLVADYTRKGFVRGRTVRLMTVTVRPGKPNAAASSFVSGIIREPLAGQRATCPVAADTPIVVSSPARTVEALGVASTIDDAGWGSRTAMNAPGLTTTPREMVEALARVAGPKVASLVDWMPDPAIEAIVASWPAEVVSARAARLGLTPELSFDDIIRNYLEAI